MFQVQAAHFDRDEGMAWIVEPSVAGLHKLGLLKEGSAVVGDRDECRLAMHRLCDDHHRRLCVYASVTAFRAVDSKMCVVMGKAPLEHNTDGEHTDGLSFEAQLDEEKHVVLQLQPNFDDDKRPFVLCLDILRTDSYMSTGQIVQVLTTWPHFHWA